MVFLNYFRPIEDVDALLVREMEREALEAILAEDPFVAVAEYEVTKVNVTRAAEAFAGLKGV
ncbi:hypothetical protein [Pantoea sp. WMus005]|uniref:hypothetical protein n=1 Tax=Pantoea TaxID=53335 RepID=UPI0015D02C08|nr:hypothetical protein [Pantoea sp. WMus005]NYS31113.1 hypothetical protein [Pantoea sp. WMus005]